MRGYIELLAIFRYILGFWELLQSGYKMGTLVRKELIVTWKHHTDGGADVTSNSIKKRERNQIVHQSVIKLCPVATARCMKDHIK